MTFSSDRQRKFLFSEKPEIAKKFVADAKSKGEPVVIPKAKKIKDLSVKVKVPTAGKKSPTKTPRSKSVTSE